jgi:hypothetical protein
VRPPGRQERNSSASSCFIAIFDSGSGRGFPRLRWCGKVFRQRPVRRIAGSHE